jgi:F-type H+-transporting ATPase subunit delta
MAEHAENISTRFDPGQEHLGEVYAKALLGATEKTGTSDAVVAEFESLVEDVLNKLPALRETLFSLRVSHDDKLALLDKAFRGRMSEQLLNFLKVLSRHHRLSSIGPILNAAKKRLNQLRGRVEVFVTTAAPISNQLLETIDAKLVAMLGKQVIINTSVAPDLLGGLVVRVGDTVYDSSLATQLQKMRTVALEHTEQKIRQSLGRFVGVDSEQRSSNP